MPLIVGLKAFWVLEYLEWHFNSFAQGAAASVIGGKHATTVLQVFRPNGRPTKAKVIECY